MKNIKLFEEFLNGEEVENLSKISYAGEVDKAMRDDILNVNNFNDWIDDNSPGLIGRIDVLSNHCIESYFTDKGVQCNQKEISDFINKIKNEWLKNRK